MSDLHFASPAIDRCENTDATPWERPRDEAVQAYEPFTHWARLVDWLPRLGVVLWSCPDRSDGAFPRARILDCGVLLFDHPALSAFVHCTRVIAHAEVGSCGPREWLALSDAQGACLARMHLLPDTDYLAWDGMIAACALARVAGFSRRYPWRDPGCDSAVGIAWRTTFARFPSLRLPCLQLLGLRRPTSVSVLGAQVAALIARDEVADLDDFAVMLSRI